MPISKITKNRIKLRRQRVEQYLMEGVTDQGRIAAALGVSDATISRDVDALNRKWDEFAPAKGRQRRRRRLAQLDYVMHEAWNAFRRSCKPAKEEVEVTEPCSYCKATGTVGEEQDECMMCGGVGEAKKMTVKVKDQAPGDPAFLRLAADMVKEGAKIEGLYNKHRIQRNEAALLQQQSPQLLLHMSSDQILELMALLREQGVDTVDGKVVTEQKAIAGE